jgi:drug/metabolite transporter (DMT)-like permease
MLLPLELTAIVLYMRALKVSPLSLTIPFLALTPVFLIFTSYFVLGELPDVSGALGIICIAIGAYLLNINQLKKGILAPVKSILKERGSLMMIGVAFIFSLTSTLGKRATLLSSPLFFGTFYTFLLALFLSPAALIRWRKHPLTLRLHLKTFLPIGFFYALMVIFHYRALAMVDVSYMISIKRTSLLLSIIYGGLFFKESNIGERLCGGICMIAGVILITLI